MILKKYRVPFIIFLLTSLIFTFPFFFHFDKIGIVDWDQWLFHHEALRKSILEYHQIAFWNPYYCGGNILLTHPAISFFSPILLLVLLFGTITGLKIAITLHFFLGLMSMYLLARQFKLHSLASYASAFIYMFSAQFALRIGDGTFSYLAMGFYPLAFLYFLKGQREWKCMVPTVVFLVLAFFSSAVYELAFFLLFLSIYAFIKSIIELKLRPLTLLAFIFLFTFLLASVKLIPVLDFINDNPRTAEFSAEESTTFREFSDDLLKSTRLSKYYTGAYASPKDPQWWEGNIGIGILGTLVVLIGGFFCFKREKALLFTTIIFILIFFGSTFPISLWKLLHYLPPFNSFYVIDRLSIMLTFAFALIGGFGFSGLQNKFSRLRLSSYFFWLLLIILAGSLFFMNWPIINDALQLHISQLEKNDMFFQTVKEYNYDGFSNSGLYLSILENKGNLLCYEEILPFTSVSAIPKESMFYKGEAYLKYEGKAKIISFSPNKVSIEVNTDRENLLVLNQNYEKNWKVKKGEIENYQGLLATRVPKGINIVTFYYLPISFIVGSILTIISLLLIYFFVKGFDKRIIIIVMSLLLIIAFLFLYTSKDKIDIPKIYQQLDKDPESYSIIEIPFTSPLFHALRYYTYQHDKEVIWHHPSQKISYKVNLLKKIFFANDSIDEKVVSDIIIQDPQKIALSVLNYYNIKKVILHKTWYGSHLDWKIFSRPFNLYDYSRYKDWNGNEHYNKTKEYLDKTLNKGYEDEEIILYDVPEENNKLPFLLMDKGWYWLEFDDYGKRFGWIGNKASINIISFKEINISLKFKTFNFYRSRILKIYKDNEFIGNYKINNNEEITIDIKLKDGENKIEFRSNCEKPSKVLNSEDIRCLSVALRDLEIIY